MFFCFVFFLFLSFVFQDRVSLYTPGCLGIHSVDQDDFELRTSPASVSQMLGLEMCANTTQAAQCF